MNNVICPFCGKSHLPGKENNFDLSEENLEPGLYRIECGIDPEIYLKKINIR
jgi:hypothetical protein